MTATRKIAEAGLPQAWRSSFAKYGAPKLSTDELQHYGEYLQFLAWHAVTGGRVSMIRRIEATPTLRLVREEQSIVYRLPELPEQGDELQDPTLAEQERWHWRWVLGYLEAKNTSVQTGGNGAIIQVPQPLEVLPLLAGFGTLHFFHGEPQRMHGAFPAAAVHGTGTRFDIEGPAFIFLAAIVSGGRPNLQGDQAPLVFGNSYGSLEGIDVDEKEYLASQLRHFVP